MVTPIGVFMMILGALILLMSSSSGFIITGFGSCLTMGLILFGLLLTVLGIKSPNRNIG
jgi:hypothetical protein